MLNAPIARRWMGPVLGGWITSARIHGSDVIRSCFFGCEASERWLLKMRWRVLFNTVSSLRRIPLNPDPFLIWYVLPFHDEAGRLFSLFFKLT